MRLPRSGSSCLAPVDVYRDLINTPAFLGRLPEMEGRSGLDLGCGEGHNTRLLAERGTNAVALDVSQPARHFGHRSA